MNVDIIASFQSTITLLISASDAGESWLQSRLIDPMRFGRGYIVEHRYVRDILDGIEDDGLALEVILEAKP